MVNLPSSMVSEKLVLRSRSSSSSASTSPERSPTENGGKKSPFQRLRRKLSPKRSGSNRSDDVNVKDISIKKEEESEQLRRVFEYFDENGDGGISPVELRSCVVSLGGKLSVEEAEMAVKASDLDGDGLLGFEEFEKLMEYGGDEDKNKDLKEAFGMYVPEGKQCITASSLKKMLSRLGDSRSIEECKKMIKAFDLNGDGELSFDEFRIMMR